LILILHVLGFFAILIPLVILGPHGDVEELFTTFVNNGGWPSQGLSFMVGMMGNVFAFVGTDAAFHVCLTLFESLLIYTQWRSLLTRFCRCPRKL
jgi:hypothetical protein